MRNSVVVEAAVDTLVDALAAEREGVDRVELCGPLLDGGTTPSAALIARCADTLSIPVHVLIRPRTGDFVYTAEEIALMHTAIAAAQSFGADGVVLGALTPAGTIDLATMRALTAAASPMRVGFHRAFDRVRDQVEALEQLVALRVAHILSSGAAPTALEGVLRLRPLVERAGDRVQIIAGGSVTAGNVAEVVARTGVGAVHGRAFQGVPQRLRQKPGA